MEDIQKLLEEGKYYIVIQHYRERPPESIQDFLAFGIALFYAGFSLEALGVFEAGLSKFPNNVDLLVNAAEVSYQLGNLEKAFEYAKKVLQMGVEDPYMYDIMATYYQSIGEESLKEVVARKAVEELEKSSNYEQAEQIKVKFSLKIVEGKRKKLLIIGPCANYSDSFVKFVENGWDIYVLETPVNRNLDTSNYEAFVEMGAKIVKRDDFDEFVKEKAPELDLIFRTGCFLGGDDAGRSSRFGDIWQLNYLYKVSRIVKENGYKAKTVLAFNGDTFVHDPFWANWLEKRLEYVDYILFDTDNLRRYFLKHVEIPKETETTVMLVEVPLKRELRINFHDSYVKQVLTIGRRMLTYEPIPAVFIKSMDTTLALGGGGGYIKRLRDRDKFEQIYGKVAFGLGYFHDFYLAKDTFEDLIERSLEGFSTTMRFHSYVPKVYQYTNVPGKVISYLQFGIVPILPRNGNDFYEKLFEKGMAIAIEKDTEFFDPTTVSDEEITQMRKNILQNADLFTFDVFFEFVETRVLGGR